MKNILLNLILILTSISCIGMNNPKGISLSIQSTGEIKLLPVSTQFTITDCNGS